MAGRPKKPRGLKLLQGTLRKDRDAPEVEFPVVDQASAPDWMVDPEAVKTWNWLAGLLLATRILTEPDQIALGHLCNLHADCVKLYRAKMAPTAAQLAQLRCYLEQFGMTPASRSKARPAGDGKPANAFSKLAGAK